MNSIESLVEWASSWVPIETRERFENALRQELLDLAKDAWRYRFVCSNNIPMMRAALTDIANCKSDIDGIVDSAMKNAALYQSPADAAPTPTDDELFAAYWKDQTRTNFYAHGPAQIAEGLRNVYFLGLKAGTVAPLVCNNINTARGDVSAKCPRWCGMAYCKPDHA